MICFSSSVRAMCCPPLVCWLHSGQLVGCTTTAQFGYGLQRGIVGQHGGMRTVAKARAVTPPNEKIVQDQHGKTMIQALSATGSLYWPRLEERNGGRQLLAFQSGDKSKLTCYSKPGLHDDGWTARGFLYHSGPLFVWVQQQASVLMPKKVKLLGMDEHPGAMKLNLTSQADLCSFFRDYSAAALVHPSQPDVWLREFADLRSGELYHIVLSAATASFWTVDNIKGQLRNQIAVKEIEVAEGALLFYQQIDPTFKLFFDLRVHKGINAKAGQEKEYDFVIKNDKTLIVGSCKSTAKADDLFNLEDDVIDFKRRTTDDCWPSYAAFRGMDVRGAYMAEYAPPELRLPERCKKFGFDLFERSGTAIRFHSGPSRPWWERELVFRTGEQQTVVCAQHGGCHWTG